MRAVKQMQHLKELRKAHKINQQALASYMGVARSTISMWESGASQPDNAALQRLAAYFHVSIDYLLGFLEEGRGVKVPVLGNVAAGIPIEVVENIIDYEEISTDLAATGEFFALQIHGTSMEPRIMDGDVVIVRKQPEVENGQIAIVLVNGYDATCKRLMREKDGIRLVSFNPNFPPMHYSSEEVANLPIRVLGRVVELRGKF